MHASSLIVFEESSARSAKADETHDVDSHEFISVLSQTPWLPALTRCPEPFVPWGPEHSGEAVVRASGVRPAEELWLCSSCYRILDGHVRSERLRRLCGWLAPPSLTVLATQLSALGAQGHAEETAFKQSMALAVPTLYRALERALQAASLLNTPSCSSESYKSASSPTAADAFSAGAGAMPDPAEAVLRALQQQPCIWVGNRFVDASLTAMRSPLNLFPYLHVVPADLHCFSAVLQQLGVRERFESTQLIFLLDQLARQADGRPLQMETLQMVLAVVQQLASPECVLNSRSSGLLVLAPAPSMPQRCPSARTLSPCHQALRRTYLHRSRLIQALHAHAPPLKSPRSEEGVLEELRTPQTALVR
eukprot:1916424-Pleurochrysis_carterae.AAC.2